MEKEFVNMKLTLTAYDRLQPLKVLNYNLKKNKNNSMLCKALKMFIKNCICYAYRRIRRALKNEF